jgi:hypothetical protein
VRGRIEAEIRRYTERLIEANGGTLVMHPSAYSAMADRIFDLTDYGLADRVRGYARALAGTRRVVETSTVGRELAELVDPHED